jgi:transposase
MYLREKQINGYRYLYLVESVREDGRTKQRIIKNLGRKEVVLANGDLERLAASVARHAEHALVLSALEKGEVSGLTCRRIGPPLLFGRLWQATGCQAVIESLLANRAFEFPVERAIFVTVLHRLMVSGSDRSCEQWLQDYAIPDSAGLQLHHFYRAMAWLGEELDEADQHDATPFAPRCVKDLIEERLFERRRDLFTDLSLVFLDTTTLSFTGQGGETLGRHGHSKDHRPDLLQMVLAVVMDGEGRPVCTEMGPGNTADVTALLPIIDRLRARFAIGRVCVVADRGMISRATIEGLEARKLDYILGARERSDPLIRQVVLEDRRPFTPLCITRAKGRAALRAGRTPKPRDQTQLWVKEVVLGERRYVVCRNETEANQDAADRAAVLDGLERQLKKGDKALIGNSAYRRFLKTTTDQAQHAFEIDPGKVADEARFDGIFVLRTNATISPLQAVLRYRDLLQVESLFRTAKALMRTRPIYHQSDAAIRGHVFCSFLALVLKKELVDRCDAHDFRPEWDDVRRDLDRLQDVEIQKDGKRVTLRTPTTGTAGRLFQAAGVALPPQIKEHHPA